MGFLSQIKNISMKWSKSQGVEVEYIPKGRPNLQTIKTTGFPAAAITAEQQTDRIAKGQTVNLMNLAAVPLDFKPLVGDAIKVDGVEWKISSFSGSNPYDFVLESNRMPTGERRHGFA